MEKNRINRKNERAKKKRGLSLTGKHVTFNHCYVGSNPTGLKLNSAFSIFN